MYGKNFFKTAAVVSIALACISIKCYCAEHPEHPTGKQKPAGLTKDQLADAIEAYIKKEAAANNGNFPITDEKSGEKLQLTLERVHRERLARVGDDKYFACVDFKNTKGTIYDVDFFMKGTSKENLTFSEFMIHKVDGKARYTWHEENGVWKRKPVESAEQPKEKPKAEPNEKPK
jgi:hypothetical protein